MHNDVIVYGEGGGEKKKEKKERERENLFCNVVQFSMCVFFIQNIGVQASARIRQAGVQYRRWEGEPARRSAYLRQQYLPRWSSWKRWTAL